jgi:hypothetical protein
MKRPDFSDYVTANEPFGEDLEKYDEILEEYVDHLEERLALLGGGLTDDVFDLDLDFEVFSIDDDEPDPEPDENLHAYTHTHSGPDSSERRTVMSYFCRQISDSLSSLRELIDESE